jgi:uncharacterized protein (TIGR02118 family)
MGLIIANDYVIKGGPTLPGAAKGVGFACRKSGMTVEAFQRHWRVVHGPLGAAVPGLRRYVQSHPRPSGYGRGQDPAWDGIAIIWFDDFEALHAATGTSEWDRVKADEANFVAPGPVAFIATTEHVIVG